MSYRVKVLLERFVTHDVTSYVVEKPEGFVYRPGKATKVAIDEDAWRDQKRPFTFTSTPDEEVLEFTIKHYPQTPENDHDGMTERLASIKAGDYLLIEDPYGAIEYKGKGVFIAGGAGITPFLSLLRDLKKRGEQEGHMLIFSNKELKDCICEKELRDFFGFNPNNLVLTFTREKDSETFGKRVDKDFLSEHIADFNQKFYVCGPPPFTKGVLGALKELGAEAQSLVFEE